MPAGRSRRRPRTLDRIVRFAVLADYGSGNDNEWAVGRVLAAQRPEFAVTAGDNSYLVAAEPLLDRNIFRPLGDLIGSTPMYVCLGDHDNFWPGPGAISRAFDIPAGGSVRRALRADPGRRSSATSPTSPPPSSSPERRCASPARPCASSPAIARCTRAMRCSPSCARRARLRSSAATCTATSAGRSTA